MGVSSPFVLLDDARDGGTATLFSDVEDVIVAHDTAGVPEAIARLRAALAAGRHVAGYLAYEAGSAFESAATTRPNDRPILWFGVFAAAQPIDATAWLPSPAGAFVGEAMPAIDRDSYDARFARVKALIAAGDVYQVNLTFPATARLLGDPRAAYARLRTSARAGWGALIDTGEETILSLSPESFFTLASGTLTCRPMKGTARRREDPSEDAAAAQALAADEKQRAENLMIVDLMRNDLSRVATPGSVRVPDLFAVEHYPTVHQMVSTVTADLASGNDAIDVLAALFPCGSITGAPKVRAMQVIAEVEEVPRGLYTGAIGRIDPDGNAQFNVAIRTLTLPRGSDIATLGIGGGIVADSRADEEWDEALAKAAFLQHGQRGVDLIETMAFDPDIGLPLIERHLARMKASATAFGFAFDRHHARNELQAATFRLRHASRIRLIAAASGAIAIEVAPAPPTRTTPLSVAIVPLPVAPADIRLRHKTADRAFYDEARLRAGTDEVVFADSQGFLTEGSFTSLFVPGGDVLLTPPLERGLLPGVLRAELIDTGRAVERDVRARDLPADFFVGNALRGLMPARLAVAKDMSAPL